MRKILLTVLAVGGLAGAGGALWVVHMQQVEADAAAMLRRIEQKVAADAVEQYQIAKHYVEKNSRDRTELCALAGMVAASFLQAKDAAGYRRWKDVEHDDCIMAQIDNLLEVERAKTEATYRQLEREGAPRPR